MAEYEPKYSVIPGWVLSSGVYAKLSGSAAKLLTVLGAYAHRKRGGSCWTSRQVLRKVSGLPERSFKRGYADLLKHGVIAFANRPGKGLKNRTVWVAMHKAFSFASETTGPEFDEYNRLIDSKRAKMAQPKSAKMAPLVGAVHTKIHPTVQGSKRAKNGIVNRPIWPPESKILGFIPPKNKEQFQDRKHAEAGIEAGIVPTVLDGSPKTGLPIRCVSEQNQQHQTATMKEESSMLDSFEESQPETETTRPILFKDIRGLEDIPEPKPKPPRKPRKKKPRGLEDIKGREPKGSTSPPKKKKARAKKKVVKKKVVKKPAKELSEYTDSPPHLLLDRHCKNFKARFKTDYMPDFAKDLGIAKMILKVHGFKNATLYNDEFFRIKNDPFIEDGGFTFPMFRMRINKLVVMTNNTTPARNTPKSAEIPVGSKRGQIDRGYEFYWEEWNGTDWVSKTKKK